MSYNINDNHSKKRSLFQHCNKLEKEIQQIRNLQKQIEHLPEAKEEYNTYEQDIKELQSAKRTALQIRSATTQNQLSNP